MCLNAPVVVQEGLAKTGPQADRTVHAQALSSTETRAKTAKKNLWKDYVEPVAQEDAEPRDASSGDGSEPQSDKTSDFKKVRIGRPHHEVCVSRACMCVCMLSLDFFRQVVVTEITSCCHFWVQLVEQGAYNNVHVVVYSYNI